MSQRIADIENLVSQFPPGNLNRKLWALVIAELKDLEGRHLQVRYCGHEAPVGQPCPICYPEEPAARNCKECGEFVKRRIRCRICGRLVCRICIHTTAPDMGSPICKRHEA